MSSLGSFYLLSHIHPSDNPGSSPHLKRLNLITSAKFLVPQRVTYSQVLVIRMWTSCVCVCVCVCLCQSLSRVQFFGTSWTVTRQALLSMEFSRQEYWSRLPFPSPGDLPDPRIKSRSLQGNPGGGTSWRTIILQPLSFLSRYKYVGQLFRQHRIPDFSLLSIAITFKPFVLLFLN